MPPTNVELRNNHHLGMVANNNSYASWRTLWDENTELKAKPRAHPFILFSGDDNPALTHRENDRDLPGAAGDIVKIPEPEPREEPGQTDSTHPFVVVNDKVCLRLRVLDEDYKPIKNAKYKLVIDGIRYPRDANPDEDTVLPADGLITHEVTPIAQRGSLTIKYPAPAPPPRPAPWPAVIQGTPSGSGPVAAAAAPPQVGPATVPEPQPDPIEVSFMLEVGRLNPIKEQAPDVKCTSGVQQRLNNMAFDVGIVDGVDDDRTKAAIKRFQRRIAAAEVKGEIDDPLQTKLKQYHDDAQAFPDLTAGTVASP